MLNDFITLNNVGTREGGIRLGAGVVAVLWGLTGGGFLIALIGIIAAVTGYFNSCQIYKLLGRNTNTDAAPAAAAATATAAAATTVDAATETAANTAEDIKEDVKEAVKSEEDAPA